MTGAYQNALVSNREIISCLFRLFRLFGKMTIFLFKQLGTMATVKFTSNLKRFYPDLNATKTEAQTVAQLIEDINGRYPGLKNYIIDDQNRLRHHVNIFINQSMIQDRQLLQDKIGKNDSIYIMQALSGG